MKIHGGPSDGEGSGRLSRRSCVSHGRRLKLNEARAGVASPEKSFSLALSGSGGPGRTVSQPKNSSAKARLLMNIRFNLKTAHTTQVKPVISADLRNPNQRRVADGAA